MQWAQNGLSYAAVSDLNLEELRQFAQAVRRGTAESDEMIRMRLIAIQTSAVLAHRRHFRGKCRWLVPPFE